MSMDYGNPRCRVCGKTARLRQDGTAGPHRGKDSRQCDGSGRPPAGEPPCLMTCRAVGFMGWPGIGQLRAGEPHASTHVCDSPSHQVEASAWVRSITGHDGVFQLFTRRAEPVQAGLFDLKVS
jgi:hypothetical protein